MRIIGISGVWREDDPLWDTLGPAFLQEYPHATFVSEVEFMHPWDTDRLRACRDRTVEKYDDGEKTIFVGHSMGGPIVCASAQRFERSCVLGIVTIFSPHQYFYGEYLERLEATGPLPAPIITFGGRLDPLVPWGTRHPDSVRHEMLWADHRFALLYNVGGIANHIARVSKETF